MSNDVIPPTFISLLMSRLLGSIGVFVCSLAHV